MNRSFISVLLGIGLLCGCGQKGPLYLPEKASEIVTRPAAVPAETSAPNSPQTVDSPAGPASPAPEVVAPDVDAKEKDKNKSTTVPPQN